MNGLFMVLNMLGGLVLFLYGMDLMGDSLKKLAGGKLESVLAKLTSNDIKGFFLGLGVTAIIQSSSATTVMLVGFVNSGIMTLRQTISVILGANIGTTFTSWLLSTAGISGTANNIIRLFKPESFTPILAVIGLIMIMTADNNKKKNIGNILIGFAILMFGMNAMSDAVNSLRDNETFTGILTTFSNPIMGILAGTIFTAIIQSSSASVGILQALSLSCSIPFSTAIPIILGQNIGTTITPVISSISGNTDSKRVAASCVIIKFVGVALIGGGFYAINTIIGFDFLSNNVNITDIALIHTLFNVLSTIILLPFCSLFSKLAQKAIKNKSTDNKNDIFSTLDERFLDIPSFAVQKCRELVYEMSNISKEAFNKAIGLLNNFDKDIFENVNTLESLIDRYEDKTSTYLVHIAESDISAKDSKLVTELLHCIGDIERISDHALNIAEVAKEIHDKNINFSDNAKRDIAVITSAVNEALEYAITCLKNENLVTAKKVEPLEQVIDDLKRKIKNRHISRLRQGDCTIELGFVLSDLLTNYERISDHCSNIAVCVIEIAHDTFETHQYLNHIKTGENTDFNNMYNEYKIKYSID